MINTFRTLFTFIIVVLSITFASAQKADCNCKKDLDLLKEKIKKSPAYKVNKTAYTKQLVLTEKSLNNIKSSYDCFVALNKLMLSLNDNHSRIYGINTGANAETKADEMKFAAFKQSNLFTSYPRPKINLDSLTTALESKASNATEGIYSINEYMKLGVYKMPNEKAYRAIVLESQNEIWEIGEVIYTLLPFGNNYLLAIGGSLSSKRMVAHTERIDDGTFLTVGFKKEPSTPMFSRSLHPNEVYVREEISSEITYLKIGSFNSWNKTLAKAQKFYKTLEGTLTKQKLIIDLRDNGGGGNRNSNILFDIIKDYLKNNKVYVLINNRTSSNAEQFALKLSAFDNCMTFGNRTNGTAAYEIVDGNYELPCGKYIAVLTSKKHSKFLHLESNGLEPNVKFNTESEWIGQLQAFIQINK